MLALDARMPGMLRMGQAATAIRSRSRRTRARDRVASLPAAPAPLDLGPALDQHIDVAESCGMTPKLGAARGGVAFATAARRKGSIGGRRTPLALLHLS